MNSTSRPTTIRVYGSSLSGPPAAPFKPYVYKGENRPGPKPGPKPGPPKPRVYSHSFSDSKCGTRNGYERHRYHKVDPCQPCLDANAAYYRVRKDRRAASGS